MASNSRVVRLPAWYYRQCDANYGLAVPAEGYAGWQRAELPLSLDHTAVVVMHAWDCGTREEFPGWYRAVEYLPRAARICREVFPGLLAAVRGSPLKLFHVVSGGGYFKALPGYRRAVALAGPPPEPPPRVKPDPVLEELLGFEYGPGCWFGKHNQEDIRRAFARVDFAAEARPAGDEGVAENDHHLFALCREAGINHLIYAGFAINWCLLLSPGGMAEMSRHGLWCSALRQATTAVENRETARAELCKEIALWRVALSFGLVYDVDDFVRAMGPAPAP